MNFFIPALMLFIPGIIAVSVHIGRLIHVTRENWQSLMWLYLLYSLAIVFVVYFIMFLSYPQRSISFSPWATEATSSVLHASFIVKYTLFASSSALCLPKLWEKRREILDKLKNILKHILKYILTYKVADDE